MNVKPTLRTSGLAGAMVLAAGSSAYANIVTVATPADFNVAAGTASVGPVLWDVNGDGATDFQFTYRYPNTATGSGVIWQANMNPFTGTQATNGALGYQGTFIRYAEAFTLGTIFGPTPPANTPAVSFPTTSTQVTLGSRYLSAGTPSYYGGFATGPTPPGTQAYVGFRFTIGANTHYGWLLLSVGPGSIDFVSAAYDNTPNTPIAAGAIPEPSTLAFLSLGAVGVLGAVARRRRAA
ncbi:MAG: PEP-CTERM sorting domain-containing protein [Verrucomicrobia bacterium]|nr:PEP-CTERM sorting domain-containing protein [Verrucomicrobiota bacterium]